MVTFTQQTHQLGPIVAEWNALGNAETGAACAVSGRADMTVTATGTFGAATVHIEGSNDNANWFAVDDFLGVVITFAAAGINTLGNSPLYVRARTSGGTGTDVDVILVAKPI